MLKRFLSIICAFAIVAHIAVYPTRSRAVELAAGAALTAVGFTTCVLAFLNAAKIYPYNTSTGTYEEWEESSLEGLISDYNSSPSGLSSPINGNTIRGYIAAGTICIVHNSWTILRQFASWIVSEFGLSDNQSSVSLGSGGRFLAVVPEISISALAAGGIIIGTIDGASAYGGALMDGVLVVVKVSSSRKSLTFYSSSAPPASSVYAGILPSIDSTYIISSTSNSPSSYSYNGKVFYVSSASVLSGSFASSGAGILVLDNSISQGAERQAIYEAFYGESAEDSITVDTGEISIPEELPEDKGWGGLAVAGALAGIAGGLAEILKILQKGVGDRVKPAVTPVDVSIAEGTEVVDETGEVIQDVVITPDFVDFSPETFQIPDLTGVFPFSIPWDIIRIYQAFDSEPRRPEWHADLIPADTLYPGQPAFHVDIALPAQLSERFDEVAAMVRAFMLVIACIGLTIWLGKYIDF